MSNSFTVPNITHFVFDFFKEKFNVKAEKNDSDEQDFMNTDL